MDILCRAGRHSRGAHAPVWNNGYWFSSCERCGCDLVRRGGGRWRAPPKGYKVVWRPRRVGQIDWNGLIAMRPDRRPADALPMLEASNDRESPEPAEPPTVEESDAEPLSV
ncbi:MAG TPA: hypothetical protein VFW19_12495 [Allosphingosinicella sp.]|nr:hypothetical protein [Allosphingosinicella sp.]